MKKMFAGTGMTMIIPIVITLLNWFGCTQVPWITIQLLFMTPVIVGLLTIIAAVAIMYFNEQ